jgi:hypothetical protein
MAASRNWCPALSAAPEMLQIGLSSPSKSDSPSPTRARPQSPKNKGSKAAALSVTTASNGIKLVDRVRQDRAFSNKVALSLATTEELASILFNAGETVDAASYVSHLNPDAAATPGAEGEPLKLAAPLIVRNAVHLTEFLKPNADGTQLRPQNVVLSDADLTTEALVGLVDGPIEQVNALTVQRSLHGTNSLAALCTALYGGAPPPEEPEPEAAVDPDEQGEEEVPVAKPPKPVWAPKKRSIQFLKLASNAVGFGAAAGEDPSAAALEELTKLIGQSSVAPIKHLSLSNCYLQSAGGAAVATAVLPSGTIETLDLSGNGIGKGDDGAATQAVAQLVQENKFLTSIDLSANDFDAAQSKQILEALANSKTRVATPEPNPEPEPEEYTDELPPEEEPPTVEIGFPADKEKEKEQGEGEESAPAEEGNAAEPEPQAAAPPPAGDEGEEGEEEGEEEEEEPKPKPAEAAKKTVKIEEKPEEPPAEAEEDEEAAEERRRREEEKEEAEREALEAAKAAWAEKQEQYIWGPQRVHAEYGETVSRRVILKAHIDETTQLKSLERASRADAKKRQLHREKEDRERRSGWTHLKVLNFSGNPMGSVGAKALADAIRKKIPLSEEEIQRAEEAADAFVAKATEAAEAAAAAKAEADKAAEEAARELAAKEAEEQAAAEKEQPAAKKQAAPAPPPPEDDGEAGEENADGEGEGQQEAADNSLEDAPADAPQEEPPQQDAEPEEAQATQDEPEQDEEGEQAAEADAPTSSASPAVAAGIVRPKVEKDRDGIQTLRVLNLGSCGIGSKGLKALSSVLKDNNDSLKTLILKRNKFGVKHAEVPPPDAKEDDDPPKPMLRVDVTSWVSPGVQALSEALSVNRTLTVLDLSYNNMYPTNLALLASGLQKNRTLEVLLLDGNHWNSNSLLLQLVQAIGGEDSAVTTLGLSSAGIEGALTREVAQALTNCQALRSLNLDSNGLTAVEASNLSSAIADAPPNFRLRALSLQNNAIHGVEGGVALGGIAKSVSSLQSLRFSGNAELGDEAFAELCNLISNHSALKVFSASRTGITTIAPLTAVASSLGMLTMVELADNEINPESVIRFAQEVRRMSTISFISVWGRTVDIESAAMRDFVEAAKTCPTLFQVDLGQGLGAATAPPTPPDPSEDPPQSKDDLLSDAEKLEKYCFRNRLQNAAQRQ